MSISSDEAMHWLWSKHPALAYPEHPPLVAYLIYLGTAIFGDNELGVRFFFVLGIFFLGLIIWELSREKGEKGALFSLFLFHLLPITQLGVLAKTDLPFIVFYFLAFYALRKNNFYLLAFSLGGAILSKLLGGFLLFSILLYFFLQRIAFWKRKDFIPSLLLFLLLISPVVIWNITHDFFEIKMRFGHQVAQSFTLRYFPELFLSQFLIFSPLVFPLFIYALFQAFKERDWLILSFSLPIILFFFLYSFRARAGIHWVLAGFLILILKVSEVYEKTQKKFIYHLSLFTSTLFTIFIWLIPFIPQIIPSSLCYSGRKEWVNARRLNELYGWRELGKEAKKEYKNIEAPKFILVSRWGLATLISFYTKEVNTFTIYEPTRNGRSFYLWEKEFNFLGRNALIICDYKDKDPEKEFLPWFEKVVKRKEVVIKGRRYVFWEGKGFKKLRPHI